MPSPHQETFCARFVRQFNLPGDPDANPCAVCGWLKSEHITYEDLELALERREARLIVDRARFRLLARRGFHYACVQTTEELRTEAANNRPSDYRGTRSYWQIESKTPEPESAEAAKAESLIRNWEPEIWEQLVGRNLQPGESLERDADLFHAEHANDLVVTTAWGDWSSWVPKGMVGVRAHVGGYDKDCRTRGPARFFLVPREEYDTRDLFGFVVDPARHQEISEVIVPFHHLLVEK